MLGLKIKVFPSNIEYFTNNEGEKKIVLKKQNKPIYGYTEYLGYERCYFSFDLNENQIIDLKVNRLYKSEVYENVILKNFNYKQDTFVIIDKKRKKEKWIKYKPQHGI